ncbi:MAG: sugar ABC transporter permease [Pseudonocardiales bacterium]|nr:sugar ABC transporter permease [Pseudonocardiales bacterium]MBV9029929.1 sugar ABC transporter permease [Pseudonocardiales bacterium]
MGSDILTREVHPGGAPSGPRRPVDLAAREATRAGMLMMAPAVVTTATLVIYPLVRGFQTSLESGDAAVGGQPHFVGLRNYGEVLGSSTARDATVHTLSYVALAVTLELALGLIVAVALHRTFRGRGIVLAILILPCALPSVVSGVLWRRVFDPDSGLLNSVLEQLHILSQPQVWLAGRGWALAFITLVHVWGVLPLVSLILIAGLQSIPEEVYSASAVDGATPLRQFRHITLPLLRPSIAVTLTVGTVWATKIFDEIYVLNGTALNTRSILMEVYNTTFVNADFAHGTALAFMLTAVTALFAAVYAVTFRRSTT